MFYVIQKQQHCLLFGVCVTSEFAVRFTISIDVPGSMAMLLQATGRAGRDGMPADCIICKGLIS
jgi:hypothetical protein